MPYTFASIQYSKIPLIFSSVSLMNGRMGQSQTTVGIPASFIFFRAATRSFVVLTFGSIFLHKSSSKVVSVICTTHFVLSWIAFKRSKSRNTWSDLVIKVKPKPYWFAKANALRTFPSLFSRGIYGSVIEPVPNIHFSRFRLRVFSNSSIAFSLISISSKSCSM